MSLNKNSISLNLKNTEIVNLIAFKKLAKKSKAEIIMITFKNIKK